MMQVWLGLVFVAVGLLSLWQGYRVVWERDSLWSEEEKRIRSAELLPKRTDDWDREQLTQVPWWFMGGLSGVLFGLWLLVF